MNKWLDKALAAASEASGQYSIGENRSVSANSSTPEGIGNKSATTERPNCANGPTAPIENIETLHRQPDRTRPETPRVRGATPARFQARLAWDPETAALVEWFLDTDPSVQPFKLQQAVYIAHAGKYFEYLKGDIAVGPNRARGKTGAFQDDLRRLYRLLHDDKDSGNAT